MEKPVQYIVRNFRKGDEPALTKIYSECFGPITKAQLRQWYRRNKTQPDQVLVCTVDERPVSAIDYVFKDLLLGEGVYSKSAGISGVCTDSDYRHRGIVTNLMKLTLDSAKNRSLSNASLYTGLDFPAHRIYLRFGFIDIMTARMYVKYLNYSEVFAKWLRYQNRYVKHSKIAQKRLQGWKKTVSIHLKEVGNLAFKFRKGSFTRLKKTPKTADIEFTTDLETYTRMLRNVLPWEKAVKQKKLLVQRGEASDIELLNRILHGRWDN